MFQFRTRLPQHWHDLLHAVHVPDGAGCLLWYDRTLELPRWDSQPSLGAFRFFFSHSARLSISGSWIAHWSDDRELTVWEREHHPGAMTFSRVDRAAFSSDEKEIVAMYRDDGQVAVIRLCDGQTRTVVVPDCRWPFSDIGFSVDASTIFLAEANGHLFRWSRESMELLPATPEPPKDVMELGLCSDGNTFFRSDRDGRIELLDLIEGALRVLQVQKARAHWRFGRFVLPRISSSPILGPKISCLAPGLQFRNAGKDTLNPKMP